MRVVVDTNVFVSALAVNGHADFLLTGDADLIELNPFRGIPIVAPATFVQGAK
jgi:predicted nucleic acid-binding protein